MRDEDKIVLRGQIVIESTATEEVHDTGLVYPDGSPVLKMWIPNPIGFYTLRERDDDEVPSEGSE